MDWWTDREADKYDESIIASGWEVYGCALHNSCHISLFQIFYNKILPHSTSKSLNRLVKDLQRPITDARSQRNFPNIIKYFTLQVSRIYNSRKL